MSGPLRSMKLTLYHERRPRPSANSTLLRQSVASPTVRRCLSNDTFAPKPAICVSPSGPAGLPQTTVGIELRG
jgi:hypothetical protein